MDLFSTFAVVAVALLIAAGVLWWSLRRRAALHSALESRGWRHSRSGDTATVVPGTGDWTITVTHSYSAQMSPPSSRIVTTVFAAPTPAVQGAAFIAGPAPRPELRELAGQLIGSATAAMTQWLGVDRLTGGRPLHPVASVDDRLLAFATQGYRSPGALTDLADAVSAWCEVYPGERQQPVVSVTDEGVCVRVRTDLLRSVEQLDAFVDLGVRCRAGIGRSLA